MTKKEIEREIKRNERRIKTLMGKIEDLKFDMKATRKAIAFWKKELKNVESKG